MQALTMLVALIVLLAQGSAFGQESGDFYYSRGKKVPVTVLPNRMGVLAREGATPEQTEEITKQVKELASRTGNNVVDQRAGRLFILEIPPEADRQALSRLPNEIKQGNEEFIGQAGFVIMIPGWKNPVLVTDEFIVQFKPTVQRDRIDALVADNPVSIVTENPFSKNQFVMRVNENPDLDSLDLSNRFQEMTDEVDFAHPNFIVITEPRESIPNDKLFGNQWHHRNTGQAAGTMDADIDTSLAWDMTRGDAATVIAVIDYGFDVNHEDLGPNLLLSWDFTGCESNQPGCGDSNPQSAASPDRDKHGTAAAGLAAAKGNNGGTGVSGSCPDCGLMLLRIPSADEIYSVSQAFGYAQRMGAAVISNSWGTPVFDIVEKAINDAANGGRGGLGSVVFFGVSNDHVPDCGDPSASPPPPALDSVIAVSGSSNRDRYDLFGFGQCVDILAPADGSHTGTLSISTTDVTGPAGYNGNSPPERPCPSAEPGPPPPDAQDYTMCFSGTSAATPLAAGVAGLVLTASPGLTRLQVQRLLQDTADKIDDSAGAYSLSGGFSSPPGGQATHGWGRINAFEAVRVVASRAVEGRAGIDIFVRDNRLDWGNTEKPSDTLFETPRGHIGHRESVDIKVDRPPHQPPPTAATFDGFDDETPSTTAGDLNKVYVRVRNRGPETATSATVKLHWVRFDADTDLPALPVDFWSAFPADATDMTAWHPLSCAGTTSSVCAITNLAYSGASVATTPEDAAQIVAFDFPAPAVDPMLENRISLLAMVDSPDDLISLASRSSFSAGEITPTDNNVTQRDYIVPPVVMASEEQAPYVPRSSSDLAGKPAQCLFTPLPPGNQAVSLTPQERQEIMDLIHNYAWTMDEQRTEDFVALFTPDAYFEVCTGPTPGVVFRATNHNEIRDRMDLLIEDFPKERFRIRHFQANTVLQAFEADGQRVVQEKTMMFVTFWSAFFSPSSTLDYTAIVQGEIVQDGGEWRFKKRTIIMDLQRAIAYAR